LEASGAETQSFFQGSENKTTTRQCRFQTLENVPFAFLALGSSARNEMTLFSDQDNALLFADVPSDQLSTTRQRFLTLADAVCTKLKQAGYPTCPGGIMAVNPAWCLSLSEWKQHFNGWIKDTTPEALLKLNVSFDLRCAAGDETLLQQLRDHVRQTTEARPEFYTHFAKNCLGYKPPLGLFGRLRPGRHEGRKTINLKSCLKPLETFARLYSVRHGIAAPGTTERINALHEAGVLPDETVRELIVVFDHLWKLRFFNQISENAGLSTNPDELDITALTDVERNILHDVLSRIPIFQTKLSYDFFGQQL
jgi:signal-transduction protein with cAMP-binding, CBS, and nucleotidyltransferase domain